MVRKAFKQAETERPGATFLILPEDVAERDCEGEPLPVNVPVDPAPAEAQVTRAVEVLAHAKNPVVLAGPGVARDGATDALIRFSERLGLPVATTFLGKGVFPDDHPNALGTIGFMVKDYANFGFDRADVVVAVGYDLVEYSPSRWNPLGDKRIIHVHRTVAEVDSCYTLAVGLQGDIADSLDAIGAAADVPGRPTNGVPRDGPGAGGARAGRRRRRVPAEAAADRGRHPRGAGPRRHRAGRHGRREDVDGAPVPHVPAQHLHRLERAGHDGVLAARARSRRSSCTPIDGCWRRWATGRSS